MKKLLLTLMCVCTLFGCKDDDKARDGRIFINGKDKMNKSLSIDTKTVDEILAYDTLEIDKFWGTGPECIGDHTNGAVLCFAPNDRNPNPDYIIDRANRRIVMREDNIFYYGIDDVNSWIDAPLCLIMTSGREPNDIGRPLAIVPYEARHAAGEQIRALRRVKDELTDEIMHIFQTAFEFYPISEVDLVNHPDYIAAFGSSERVEKYYINWSDCTW